MAQGKKYLFKNINVHKWQGTIPHASLVRSVLNALTSYPYFIRLDGFPLGADRAEHLSGLILALEMYLGPVDPKPVSYTKVSINEKQASRDRSVTAYSRTAEALAPHTDSTYMANPHDVVAFQCEIADMEGGETAMVAVDDILTDLSAETRSLLEESLFDYGRGAHAILHQPSNRSLPDIRYYRAQLDHTAMRDQKKLSKTVLNALNELDQCLLKHSKQFYFKLSTGEAVIMNNKRVLHARAQFREDSARKFYRIRRHMDLSSYEPATVLLRLWRSLFREQLKEEKQSEPNQTDIIPKAERAKAAARVGDFSKARRLFQEVLNRDKTNYEALQNLAAIFYREGNKEKAEDYRKRLCSLHPFSTVPKDMREQAVVLKARGLKGIKYTYKRKGETFAKTLQRGHFSLKHFVPKDLCYLQNLNLYDETVPVFEPAPQNVGLLINSIACGDRMEASLKTLDGFLRENAHLKVINKPLDVLSTTRANNYKTLHGLAGIEFPRTEAIEYDGSEESKDNIHSLVQAGFEFPIMVRPRFTHTGSGLQLVSNIIELDEYLSRNSLESCFYLIQWKNLKNEQGLYNKIRVFCIDGVYYPIAHLMHNDWNVHSSDRYSVMDKSTALQDLEKSYLKNMEGHLGKNAMVGLQSIRETIGLDFFGVDFTLKEDGSLYIFECNAAMRHNYDHANAFPYTRPTLDAASAAFEGMVRKRL